MKITDILTEGHWLHLKIPENGRVSKVFFQGNCLREKDQTNDTYHRREKNQSLVSSK